MPLPANFRSSLSFDQSQLESGEKGWEEEFFAVAGSLMTALGFKITTVLPLIYFNFLVLFITLLD